MDVMILGSGTAITDAKRGSPGIAVAVDGKRLLLDPGSGSLYRAARCGVPVLEVDGVFLSHLHPDHTGDLVPLMFALRNPEHTRDKALSVWGPPGLCDFMERLQVAYGDWIQPIGYERNLQELWVDPIGLGSATLTACPVKHGQAALACAVSDAGGKRMVYSGDTEYCEELAAFAEGADLFVLECSFPEGHDCPGHLTPSQAGRMASRAGCRKLLLTHFYPACKGHDLLGPCSQHYRGPILLAEDGLIVEV